MSLKLCAQVADRGETRHQRLAGIDDAEDRPELLRILERRQLLSGIAQGSADDVGVGIDQAGKQGCVAQIDLARTWGERHIVRLSSRDDLVALNHDDARRDRLPRGAIE